MTDLDKFLAALPAYSLAELRATWEERLRAPPPPIRSRDVLCRALAERLQEQKFGSDPVLERLLKTERARLRPGRRPSAPHARYRPGTVLEKEWQGTRHQVEVLGDGYRWQEQNYASLSAIARAITGVRWNGPRFFGLREMS